MSSITRGSERAGAINAALNKALGQPTKAKILQYLDEREGCCSEVAEDLDIDYHTVSYHLREMAKPIGPGLPPLLELVGTDEKRGGTQKIFKTAVRPIIDGPDWDELSPLVRGTHSAHVGQILLEEMAAAVNSGAYEKFPERTQVRMPLVLDREGLRRIGEAAGAFLREAQEIEAESCGRRIDSGEDGFNVIAGVLAFPSADSG